jgi:hypothetical protein
MLYQHFKLAHQMNLVAVRLVTTLILLELSSFYHLLIFDHRQLQFSVRLPLALRDRVWEFLDDTGSDYPSLYQEDLNTLLADGSYIPNEVMTANGITTFRTIKILITMAHQFPRVTNPIVRTRALIYPGAYNDTVGMTRFTTRVVYAYANCVD